MNQSLIKHSLIAGLMWILLLLARILVIALGLLVVPVALPFRSVATSTRTLKPHHWPSWKLVRLPKWAWPWDNLRDGCFGDIRGDYWIDLYPGFVNKLPENCVPFVKMFWWLAIRNPANNFSRYLRPIGVDARTLDMELLAGDWLVEKDAGFRHQFVRGKGKTFTYYGFYSLIPFRNGHINIRLGHKLAPKDATKDFSKDPEKAMKGFTFRFLFDRD